MSRGNKLAGKKIRMLDDLPPVMKDARNVLASMAYKIQKEEEKHALELPILMLFQKHD